MWNKSLITVQPLHQRAHTNLSFLFSSFFLSFFLSNSFSFFIVLFFYLFFCFFFSIFSSDFLFFIFPFIFIFFLSAFSFFCFISSLLFLSFSFLFLRVFFLIFVFIYVFLSFCSNPILSFFLSLFLSINVRTKFSSYYTPATSFFPTRICAQMKDNISGGVVVMFGNNDGLHYNFFFKDSSFQLYTNTARYMHRGSATFPNLHSKSSNAEIHKPFYVNYISKVGNNFFENFFLSL